MGLLSVKFFRSAKKLEQKIIIVISINNEDSELVDQLWKLYHNVKKLNKKKHKTGEEFVILKSLEKKITAMLEIGIENFEKSMQDCGFLQLLEIVKENDVLDFYKINQSNPESTKEECYAVSDILLSIGNNQDDDNEIFFLHPEIYLDPVCDNIEFCSPFDEVAKDKTTTYMHTCLTLPNPILMSYLELRAVRKQLQDSVKVFHKAMNDWLQFAKQANVQDRLSFFKDHVMNSTKKIQKAIDCNDILQKQEKLFKVKSTVEVRIGEMPVTAIWAFYKKAMAISDESWEILQTELQKDHSYNERFLVMILYLCDENRYTKQILQDEDISQEYGLTTKRSLSID